MKKFLGYTIALAVLVAPVVSFAAEFRAGEQPTLGRDELVTNDLYIAGGSVTSAGSIGGDLIAGGGNIVISGNVGADVIAGGGNVSILSNVADDVRATGGNIIINGRVTGDVVLVGGQITISGSGVGGDVAVAGGDIRIDAPVAGKLTINGGSVYINAPISGDIKIEADVVKLGGSAVISGNMTYKAKRELVKDPSAVVNGTITFEQKKGKMNSPAFAAIFSVFLVWKFFALLACALLFGLVFRRYSMEMVNSAEKRTLRKLVIGLVAIPAMLFISILLFATVVGIPFGILGLLGLFASLIFAWIVTPIIVGSYVYRYFSKKDLVVSSKTILLGVFIFTILSLVPFIGWIIQKLLVMLALGCIVSLKWRLLKEWR